MNPLLQKFGQGVLRIVAVLLVVATIGGLSSHHAFAQENQKERSQAAQSQPANDTQERQGGWEKGDNEGSGNEGQDNQNGRGQKGNFRGRGEDHEEGFFALIPIALIGLLGFWLVRNWSKTDNRVVGFVRGTVDKAKSLVTPANAPAAVAPIDIVKMRYAKGEITQDEYNTFVKDLSGEVQTTGA